MNKKCTAGDIGSACNSKLDCHMFDNNCILNKCANKSVNSACNTNADCNSDLICTSNKCIKSENKCELTIVNNMTCVKIATKVSFTSAGGCSIGTYNGVIKTWTDTKTLFVQDKKTCEAQCQPDGCCIKSCKAVYYGK